MCAYQSPIRRQSGGSSSPLLSYVGTSLDGAQTYSSNTTIGSGDDDSATLISNFSSLTINSSVTLSPAGRRRCWIVYVAGDAVINGSLTMAKGANAAATKIEIVRNSLDPITGILNLNSTLQYTCPAAGAAGGVSDGAYNVIVNGSAGTNGQTGGGGAGQGGGGLGLGTGGNGAAGTAYSGGSGGGSSSYNAGGTNGTAGGANGGAGGASGLSDGSYHAGGGAGNPGGVGTDSGANNGLDGTGGTLILIVGGNLTIGGSSVISASGSAGGSCLQASGYRLGGGGSGAGRVIILYAGTLSNSGSIVATGGAGGTGATSNGGAGGAGSVTSPTKVG